MLTRFGHNLLLKATMWGTMPRFQLALSDAVFTPTLLASQLFEPDPVNGYERKELAQGMVDWPTVATLNGEAYIESRDIPWAATGAGYSRPIRRLALLTDDGTQVVGLSGALNESLLIKPDTPSNKRTFRFRLYSGQ